MNAMSDTSGLEALAKQYEPTFAELITPDGQLTRIRYAPCGKLMFAGGFDGAVHRWDLQYPVTPAESSESNKDAKPVFAELERMRGHNGWVTGLEVNPVASQVVSGDSWGMLRCWTYQTDAADKPKTRWAHDNAHDGWIREVAISPDGKQVASCGRDGVVKLWSADEGKLLFEWDAHHEDVHSVAFANDGKTLVSGDLRGVVNKWNLEAWDAKPVAQFDAKVLFLYHRLQEVGGVRCLRFSLDGKQLIVAGTRPDNGANVQGYPSVLTFDYESGELLHDIQLSDDQNDCHIHDIILHRDQFMALVTSGQPGKGKMFLYRPGDEAPFYILSKLANCHSIALHPDGNQFAIAATNGRSNGNGRRLTKDGKYLGNHSPIQLLAFPTGDQTKKDNS